MAPKSPRKNNSFDLTQSPSHLLRRGVQLANDLFMRELGQSELTKQQFTVLAAVEQNEGVSQTDLVGVTGIDRSTLAEMIRRMIDRGLLARQRTETDQRANAVHLGANGRKALRSARAASERVEKSLLAYLPAGDRAKFVRMLTSLVAEAEKPETEKRAPAAKRR
jgi:DNA-binding MarR family transcriptional regulator